MAATKLSFGRLIFIKAQRAPDGRLPALEVLYGRTED
jgi:hypothetical protein